MLSEELNQKYFDGRVSQKTLVWLKDLDNQTTEVRDFITRVFRLMHKSKFRPEDFSPILGWALGFVPSRILPGAWGGLIPPITIGGRHATIDQYLRQNSWLHADRPIQFLDLGCGFPPFTTVETAEKWRDWQIIGADPSFGKFLVYDEYYACFDENGKLRYFQPTARDPAQWDKLYRDPDATRKRFTELLLSLREKNSESDSDQAIQIASVKSRMIVNPMKEYERPNLRFITAGLKTADITNVDIARCFNVLIYFDRQFRSEVLQWMSGVLKEGGLFISGMDWTKSTQSRYTVYQKENDSLVPREFAMSLDNLRPFGFVTWFSLHDGEYDTETMARLCGVLRSDISFSHDFDATFDELLLEFKIAGRDEEAYLSHFFLEANPAALEALLPQVLKALDRRGFVTRAAEVLRNAGYEAWRNCVGHVAVRPPAMNTNA